MREFATAILLAIALEGMFYTLFPRGAKRVMELMQEVPETQLRIGGVAAAVVSVGAIWLLRYFWR
jgi:uncharacterized protein YjeT (DUF2065 family)